MINLCKLRNIFKSAICFFLILGQNVTLTDFFPPPL